MDSTYSGGLAMSGFDYIADTNAVVYLLAGNACMKPFLGKKLAVSVITVMELLSFPEIDEKEETTIRSFLNNCEILNISEGIRELTIEIRRTYKTKLPDAIIAATAVSSSVPLITADVGFLKIKSLQVEKLMP